jgi:geranylgeranyl pyrophosphate synthase
MSSVIPYRELIETGLQKWLPLGKLRAADRLNEAIHYAVFSGGKRMRPMLALLGANVTGGSEQQALPAACAMEFLHASSLIFDDLPAMDDADVRRGRATVHLAFGEDIALLTGLALLNHSYSLMSSSPELIREAAQCIGVNGMIGGQAADLELLSTESLGSQEPSACRSRNRKTTALMRLTMVAGAMACEASSEAVRALAHCGECLGEAYQIYDDLLDQYGCAEITGKTAHQDARHRRASYPSEYGDAMSRNEAAALIQKSKTTIQEQFGDTLAVRQLMTAIDCIVSNIADRGLVPA